ncbi:MAG: hypothetical protein ABL959_15205, partial [Pyrinomonadaceae bacterium]
ALILSANVTSFGCWCRDPGPVLDRVEDSKFVIVGRLASVGETKAKIVVERIYKGSLKVGDQLDFEQGQFTDCVRGFGIHEIGQEYLFYLNAPSNEPTYAASICNGSNVLARAFDDLAYLDKISDVARKTRLSGYFTTARDDKPNVEGLLIKVTGKKSYSLKTDKNGFFEVYDLPPGDYVIEPQIPARWNVDGKYMFRLENYDPNKFKGYTVTVKKKRHASARIRIQYDISAFPATWFAYVLDLNKPDWEILPQEAKAGEVILSKRNELGILSNFAATPFELYGKRYASVEGFWQMMLYPEGPTDERVKDKRVTWKFTREQVAQMTAFEAKSAGTLAEENMKTLGIDWVTFDGKRFPYRSATPGDHYKLILASMRAKADQNPEVKRILLATGDLILKPDHHGEPNPPPEWKYYDIWMQIRSELQKPAR